MAALTLVLELRTTGQALGMIGREIALDIAALNHAPDLVSHIPGVANVTADALSRLQHPSGNYRCHCTWKGSHLHSARHDLEASTRRC